MNTLVFLKIESVLWYLAAALTAVASFMNVFLVSQSKEVSNKKLKLKYVLYAGSLTLWSSNVLLFSSVNNHDLSYFFCQILHLGAIFIPIFLFDFVLCHLNICDRFSKFELAIGYAAASFFAAALFLTPTVFIIDVVPKRNFYFFLEPGPLYIYWIAFFFYFVISSHIKVYRSYLLAKGEDKKRLAYFVFPSLFAYSSCIAYFFPVYNIFVFPYPIGCFGSTVLSSILTYAVIKQKLLGIDVLLKKTLVFTLLFALVYGIFSIVTFIGHTIFEDMFGWHNAWLSALPTVVVITLAVRPLDAYLRNVTEKYLFQNKYDYKTLLKTFTSEVLTVLNLQDLLHKTIEGLVRIIKLESCSIYLFDQLNNAYELQSSIGSNPENKSFVPDNPLIHHLKMSHDPLRIDNNKADKLLPALIDQLRLIKSKLCLPVVYNDKLIGFIALGMKKSGEDYTQEDIDVLMALARTEAIAISNAQLFEELSRTQAEAAQKEKMAVIGTLAAGINHEICNPLGIARGQCEMFLLNYKDGLYKDVPDKELIEKCLVIYDKVIKEVDRATGITKRLSSFAKPSKKFQLTNLSIADSIKEVLAILSYELRVDNIEVKTHIPDHLPQILGDKKQIEEIIFNILRNAAQAINGKGMIKISTQEKAERVVLEIEDTGCGIPPDKLNDIFNPFYTTKAPGKGTGLGLFIVKQVTERNKGTISVQSEVGKGTTFTLSFELAKQPVAA